MILLFAEHRGHGQLATFTLTFSLPDFSVARRNSSSMSMGMALSQLNAQERSAACSSQPQSRTTFSIAQTSILSLLTSQASR